jgi:DNA-binding CsgD family transcriptional regulator
MSELRLTKREKQLLRRLAAGKTDVEIAFGIGGTAKQISEQRARLLHKLGISTAAEITNAAKRHANLATYRGVT